MKLEEITGRIKKLVHENPKRAAVAALIILVALAAVITLLQIIFNAGASTYSGTIEAVVIHVGALAGGRVEVVKVKEGDPVEKDQFLVQINRIDGRKERIYSPIDGVTLERLAEPGEVITAGSSLLTISDLDALTLTVYVPEDRYGQISLGQACQVTVDSFPGQTFSGIVRHIADQAEFTPRNVQTTGSRKTTVFAIRIELAPSGGKLKPGMPADVQFEAQ